MKILSFAVPCYNSENYMRKCVDSLLTGGEDVEIIIVNDGSSDSTANIADEYAEKYPSIVKVIHQENGGHGSGVNAGIRNATGEYFKVVDSDDWVDTDSLKLVITALKKAIEQKAELDLLITNYVYEHVEDNTRNVISYKGIFPQNKIFNWDEMTRIDPVRYIIMHSVTYRTQLIRDCGVELPKHTFYVDNLFLYIPMPAVKNICYINTDFYRYYIGRSDQSVNEQVMVKRVDQQIRVTNILLESHDLREVKKSSGMLARYMAYYLSIMYTITATLLALDNSDEADKKSRELWKKLKDTDLSLYRRIRFFSKAFFMAMPGKAGKKVSVFIYRIARKVYKFN